MEVISVPDCYIQNNGTIPLDPLHYRNLAVGQMWVWIWDAVRQIFIR